MIPVTQTTFGAPGGNCFSACVASLLELSIDEVPYFMGHDDWYGAFADWLKPRGLYPLTFKVRAGDDEWRPAGFHILSGKSPRGDFDHSVVAYAGKVVHDPHPSRAGLEGLKDVMVLVPFEPATARGEG